MEDGWEKFLQINDAIQWLVKASKLAQLVPDYAQAMIFLNRAIYDRRARTAAHRACDIRPSNVDLENARQLAEGSSAPTISALSQPELDLWKSHFQLYIGDGGILSYSPQAAETTQGPQVTGTDDDNHDKRA